MVTRKTTSTVTQVRTARANVIKFTPNPLAEEFDLGWDEDGFAIVGAWREQG